MMGAESCPLAAAESLRQSTALERALAGCVLTHTPLISWKQAATIRNSAGKIYEKKLYKTDLSMCCACCAVHLSTLSSTV